MEGEWRDGKRMNDFLKPSLLKVCLKQWSKSNKGLSHTGTMQGIENLENKDQIQQGLENMEEVGSLVCLSGPVFLLIFSPEKNVEVMKLDVFMD